ncbi:GxxExxY protein [candidate division WOR-3 bacterium]|nr:GxxExxY protein [candidate division WOR-3 bacterium]
MVKQETEGPATARPGDGKYASIPAETDAVARQVVDAVVKIHKSLGPGLLESVYETCLVHELRNRGLNVESQVRVPIRYDGVELETGLRLDLLVEGRVVVEVKAVERMLPVFEAQLLTYLRLSGKRVGLLVNFTVARAKDGIKRIVR